MVQNRVRVWLRDHRPAPPGRAARARPISDELAHWMVADRCWVQVLTEHRPGWAGRCRACVAIGLHRDWPCQMWRTARRAADLAAGGVGAGWAWLVGRMPGAGQTISSCR